MSPRGLLVTLPLDSIAFRAVVASVVAVLLARLLLRASIRLPRVRVLAALLPALALLGIVVLGAGQLNLPTIMVPVDTGHQLAVPIQRGYLHFAPAAIPVLVGTWAFIAVFRVARRVRGHVLAVRSARTATADVTSIPPHRVHRVVARMGRRLGIAVPDTALLPDVAGGAAVVGIRRPVLLLDQELVGRLDNAELRGVVAHELAHIARRDNLLAFVTGVVGDLAFFVPGRRWTLERLCAEREFAADQLAAGTTRRPGALASGLLKAMSGPTPPLLGAATLVDGVTVVRRVEVLVEPAEPAGRIRGGLERGAVGLALAVVLAGAVAVPGLLGGTSGADALAVLWRGSQPAANELATPSARIFDVYRNVDESPVSTPTRSRVSIITDNPWDFHPGVLHACAEHGSCPTSTTTTTLGLRPAPTIRTPDAELQRRWTAEQILGNDAGVSVFRLTRME